MSKKIILILILFLIIYIFLFMENNDQFGSDIYIFVIDSWHLDKEQDKQIFTIEGLSHGESILQTIRKEISGLDIEIFKLDVSAEGRINQALYYESLRKVIARKKSNPDSQILVNISLAFYNYDQYHHKLIKDLNELGVGVIAAAGNDGSTKPIYPAVFEETLAVASSDRGGKEDYSNYGEHIDLAANGKFSFSFLNFRFGNMVFSNISSSGTSLAAPRVTGLLARVLAYKHNLSFGDGIEIIKNNSIPINDSYFKDGFLGSGLISKRKTLMSLDPFYYLKDIQFVMAIIILIGIVTIIFSKHKLIYIFLIFLAMLVIIPFLIFLKELFLMYVDYIPLFFMLISLFILIMLIPFFNNLRLKYCLKRYLQKNSNPDVEYLIIVVINEKKVYNIVESFFKENGHYHLEEMITLFLEVDLEKKRVLADLFRAMGGEKLVESLIQIINKTENLSHNNKLVILEIFEKMPVEAEVLKLICREIIFDYREDSWLRYQALRTLFYISRDKESLFPLLEKYAKDKDELLRLEASGLLKEVF